MLQKRLAIIALFIANLIYAGNYSIAKIALPSYILPNAFIILRVVGALIVFGAMYRLFYYEKIERKDLLRLFVSGAFGIAANQLLLFQGLAKTSPINASLMLALCPLLTIVMSFFFLKEKMTFIRIIGLLIAFAGTFYLIAAGDILNFQWKGKSGDILLFFNALFYGAYLIIVKPLMEKYKPFTVAFWIFLFGAMVVIPVGWSEFELIQWNTFTPKIWWVVAYVVGAVTCIAYFCNIYALNTVSPSIVSSFIYLQALLASIIAISMQADKIYTWKVIAGAMILIGVYLVNTKTSPKPSLQK